MTPRILAVAAIGTLITLPAAAQDGQRVSLTPTPAKVAIEEFGQVCLDPFPSAGKARQAIGRSRLGYTASAEAAGQWRAPQAVVGLTVDGSRATRCTFDAMLTEKVDPGALASQVESRLIRQLNARPPHRQVGRTIVWDWSEGTVAYSLTIDFAGPSRQLALLLTRGGGI